MSEALAMYAQLKTMYANLEKENETLRARVAELEAQIAAPADHSARVLDMVAPAAAVADVPDAKPEMPWLSEFDEGYREGWNACRDEMLAARQPSQDVVRDALFCVGRAKFPPRGGNVGLQWHVVGVADVPYRTCVPKDGELLFVLAASKGEKP